MKSIIVVFLSLLLLNSIYGQDYNKLLREGTEWDIHHALGSEICMLSGGERLYFEGDTSVYGSEYKICKFYPIINIIPGPYCPPFAIDTTAGGISGIFMREDTISKQVFIYDHSNNSEDLLYDFSLSVGDTLQSMYAGQGGVLIVESVSTITLLNGDTMGIWYLNSGEYYIESIGGSQGLCYPLIEGIGFWNIPLCITDNGEHLWGNDCFGLVGIDEQSQKRLLSAYPNPFTTSTTIEYELTEPSLIQLTIYNGIGEAIYAFENRLMPVGKHTFTWSPERLPEGMYYGVLRSEEGMSLVKLLKQ